MEEIYPNYLDLIEEAKNYNRSLLDERRLRIPFLDSQTGLAQYNCHIWRKKSERQVFKPPRHPSRGIGMLNYELIRYPARRWSKRKTNNQLIPAIDPLRITQTASSDGSAPQHYVASVNFKTHECSQKSGDSGIVSMFNSTIDELSDTESDPTYQLLNLDQSKAIPDIYDTNVTNKSRTGSIGSHSGHSLDSLDSREDSDNNNGLQNDHQQLTLLTNHSPMIDDPSYIINKSKTVMNSSSIYEETPETTSTNYRHSRHLEDNLNHMAIRLQNKNSSIRERVGSDSIKSNSSYIRPSTLINDFTLNHSFSEIEDTEFANRVSKQIIPETEPQHLLTPKSEQIIDTESTILPTGEDMSSLSLNKLATKAIIITNNIDRPYTCTACNQTYKTRPGLTYHFQHTHNVILPRSLPRRPGSLEDRKSAQQKRSRCHGRKLKDYKTTNDIQRRKDTSKCDDKSSPISNIKSVDSIPRSPCEEETNHCDDRYDEQDDKMSEASTIIESDTPAVESSQGSSIVLKRNQDNAYANNDLKAVGNRKPSEISAENKIAKMMVKVEKTTTIKPSANHTKKFNKQKQNLFCDFCLGTADKNRRTRQSEELISCTSCGSSGHPTCLQFSENIMISVKKYDWQCIDCKTCSHCDTADNEDKLLFCDDCDRSYHTYCLDPPLTELPEGHWNCAICSTEFRKKN